jgi:hypothetical protein
MRDTIEMAREVKATAYTNRHYPDRTTYTFGPEQLKAFEALVRADEREACAKVCDKRYMGDNNREDMEAKRCAAAIRARGQP